MLSKQARKQNLIQLRKEYGNCFQAALASQNFSPEEFSQMSKIPIEVIESHLTGQLRYIGYFNYAASCLNKKLKIELVD